MWCRQVVVIVRACPKGLPRWLHRILRACAPSIRRSRAGTRRRPLRTAVPHAHQGDLLLLDDWGPDRLTASQRRDLMEIIEDRYGRGSTLITSQLPVEAWHEVIGDPTFADAILDRLVHNAYRFALEGPSMRKPEVGADAAATTTDQTGNIAHTKPAKGAKQ